MTNTQDSSYIDPLQTMSQDFDIVQPVVPAVRARNVTHAQMRGVIALFNHYFRQTDQYGNKKKMSRMEKQQRWVSYKDKIWTEYGRRIRGTFASEQALIRRYSEPLTFLKYKLKRARNLRVEDLTPEDQLYYREIGGLDDVNAMISQQNNIDSVQKFASPAKKRRLTKSAQLQFHSESYTNNHSFSNDDNNHNRHRHQPSIPVVHNLTSVPPLQPSVHPQIKSDQFHEKEVDKAIDKVNDNLDIFEEEQLLKKKIEAFEITQQKINALMTAVKTMLGNNPELIGSMPGAGSLTDQLAVCFGYWLNQNKSVIISNVASKELFLDQLMTLKSEQQEYKAFLHKWKLVRMFENDSFLKVWEWIKDELSIECHSHKEEADEEKQSQL